MNSFACYLALFVLTVMLTAALACALDIKNPTGVLTIAVSVGVLLEFTTKEWRRLHKPTDDGPKGREFKEKR